nr:hypothetical protein [Tanacetum cinerariifolium]
MWHDTVPTPSPEAPPGHRSTTAITPTVNGGQPRRSMVGTGGQRCRQTTVNDDGPPLPTAGPPVNSD